MTDPDYDFVIIGSGFGGSVSALRLVTKGYRVLLLEQGQELKASDFPKTNWNLKRWLWMPRLGFRGLFRIEPFRHVNVLAGAGVGGGSLVYGNTLPIPKDDFFQHPDWSHLADWKAELAPHYQTVRRMLGAAPADFDSPADAALREVARRRGLLAAYSKPHVAVLFGDSSKQLPDPYFGGEGPPRTPCHRCGGCMTGCRHDGKNSLDKNYLYLARKRGLRLEANTQVRMVRPRSGGGYRVEALQGTGLFRRRAVSFGATRVIFAGGALGSNELLLKLKRDPSALPKISDQLGARVRTNSETLIFITAPTTKKDFSKGLAINALLDTGSHGHAEICRYSSGSGFFRLLTLPQLPGPGSVPVQLLNLIKTVARRPLRTARALTVWNWARKTLILLYMRDTEGTLRFRLGWGGRLATELEQGAAPSACIPEANRLAEDLARETDGVPSSAAPEAFLNTPSTAHILGGCVMGNSPATGVIDAQHRLFGYEGLYVIDGSTISANPGVNPSLTIAALAERAMTFIPDAELWGRA